MEKGMEKKNKFLFEFTVPRQIEKKIKVTKDGAEVEKTVKAVEQVPVAFLRPHRKLYETAEIFYSARVSEFLSQGLMPASLVAKRYIADGGPLSEEEKKNVDQINEKIESSEAEYAAIITKEVNDKAEGKIPTNEESEAISDKKNAILMRIAKLREALGEYENTYESIYDNSAESKARGRTLTWWSTQLAFIGKKGTKDYEPLYGEGDFQSKMEKYDAIYESQDPFTIEVTKIFSYLCSVYFAAKGNVPESEFSNIYRLYWNISDYVVIDEEKEMLEAEKAKKIAEEAERATVTPFPEPVPAPAPSA